MKPVKFKSRRSSFLTRQRNKIAVVGLGIVLLSYFLKEVFRGELGKLNGSISDSQRQIDSASEYGTATLSGATLNLKLRNLRVALAKEKPTDAVSVADLHEEVIDLEAAFSDATTRFDLTSGLLDKLQPAADPLRRQRDDIKTELTQTGVQVRDITSANLAVKSPVMKDQLAVLVQFIGVLALDIRISLWQDNVLTTAKQLKVAEQRLYDICTWGAHILFCLGWALSVLGVIVKE